MKLTCDRGLSFVRFIATRLSHNNQLRGWSQAAYSGVMF